MGWRTGAVGWLESHPNGWKIHGLEWKVILDDLKIVQYKQPSVLGPPQQPLHQTLGLPGSITVLRKVSAEGGRLHFTIMSYSSTATK